MTTGNGVFELKEGAGWSRGLDNVLAAELGRWFHTRRWWTQTLIWAALINAILALVVISEDSGGAAELAMLFNVFLGVFATFGVCILMQGAIVGEKQSGTATILPYIGLTFLVAVLTRSTAAAIAAGLAYALVVENILVQLLGLAGGIWAEVARYAPGSLAAALMQTNLRLVEIDMGTGVNAGLPGPWAAAGGITLYTMAFLGLSLWAFRRQNLTG